MARLNQVRLIGIVREDPIFASNGNKARYAILTVGTDASFRNAIGEIIARADSHRVRIVGDSHSDIIEEMHGMGELIGAEVYIEGRISTHKWPCKDGVMRNFCEIVVTGPRSFRVSDKNTPDGAAKKALAIETLAKAAARLKRRMKGFRALIYRFDQTGKIPEAVRITVAAEDPVGTRMGEVFWKLCDLWMR
jgi:single-stranded DNA-binding protein